MNLGLLVSYGMMCGVADYGRSLFLALRALGVEVTIFGNYGGTLLRPEWRGREIPRAPEEEEGAVVRCFTAPLWSSRAGMDLALIRREVRARRITAMIIQYQNELFPDRSLHALLSWLRLTGVKTVVTFHDSHLGKELPFPLGLVGVKVVHGRRMLSLIHGARVIPPGVYELPGHESGGSPPETRRAFGLPEGCVATLGLGRTDYRLIHGVVVRELGWPMLVLDPAGSCPALPGATVLGGWREPAEIIRILGAARATVLWYPPVEALVTSSAAQLAVASRRQVIVNQTSWFADLPGEVFTRVATPGQLREALMAGPRPGQGERQEEYIRACSWERTARSYLGLCRA